MTENLPELVTRAGTRLLDARSSAELLEAKKLAEAALHYAKVTKAANETHADCLRIITRAEMRMASEIDQGQANGEVATAAGDRMTIARTLGNASYDDIGISSQRVSEWRQLRDAGEETVETAIGRALSEARAIDEVREIRDKAVAMQTYARQAKDSELIDFAIEIRLCAERRAGELLRVMAERGERRAHGERSRGSTEEPLAPKLEDLGVTKKQSHNWQKLAALDGEAFEKRVADAKRQAVKSVEMTAAERWQQARNRISILLERWSATLQNSQLPIGLLAAAVWGFLSLGGAHAGTCVNRQDGTDTVQACGNGSYTVTDRHGRRRVYGTPNAGFERYPGQGERPVYRRRDD